MHDCSFHLALHALCSTYEPHAWRGTCSPGTCLPLGGWLTTHVCMEARRGALPRALHAIHPLPPLRTLPPCPPPQGRYKDDESDYDSDEDDGPTYVAPVASRRPQRRAAAKVRLTSQPSLPPTPWASHLGLPPPGPTP